MSEFAAVISLGSIGGTTGFRIDGAARNSFSGFSGGADNRFDFVGAEAFSGAAGELRYEAVGGYTRVEADVDGDRKADFRLVIERDLTLGEADFLL